MLRIILLTLVAAGMLLTLDHNSTAVGCSATTKCYCFAGNLPKYLGSRDVDGKCSSQWYDFKCGACCSGKKGTPHFLSSIDLCNSSYGARCKQQTLEENNNAEYYVIRGSGECGEEYYMQYDINTGSRYN